MGLPVAGEICQSCGPKYPSTLHNTLVFTGCKESPDGAVKSLHVAETLIRVKDLERGKSILGTLENRRPKLCEMLVALLPLPFPKKGRR